MADKKEKPPKEIIKFQPDALEIQNERLPLAISFCVWFPVVAMALAIIWACWAEMDVVVQGGGKLVTNEPTIVMKPMEKSVIQDVNVQVGDVVKKDQVLFTFDPSINIAEAERIANEIRAYEAELARWQAEFNQLPYVGSDEHFAKTQAAIYLQRQQYFQERMKYFAEAEKQINAAIASNEASLSKQRERLTVVLRLEKMQEDLLEKDAASLKSLLEISVTRIEMEATVDELENGITELLHQLGAIEAERESFIQEWRNSISESMVVADRNLTSYRKDYEKISKLIEYVELRSPCDAVVHEIASFPAGSAVQEAEALITLIPLTGNIELEGEIRPQDISKVQVGSEARIKLTAYPFQKYGTIPGKVRTISENTLEKQMGGGSYSYYRVRVTLDGELNKIPENFRLIPGMEAQCEIKCDRRTVIEYVIYPLIKAFDETAREP